MPLKRDFKETVQARIAGDPAYREALLKEGVELLLLGDLRTGKAILRDYINGAIGFEKLGKMTGMPTKSLMRMFGPKGNPQARNLLEVIRHLQQSEGVRLELSPSWDPLKTQQQSGAAAQPACEALKNLQQFARVPVHRGRATVRVDGVAVTGFAEFVLPAEGHAIVAFRSDSRQLGGDFAEALLIEGTAAEGAFRIHSPQCYTRPQAGGMNAGWSLISPINRPVRIEYGSQRPVRRCRVLFNKFDYECGDAALTRGGFTRQGTPLQVELNGRQAEFRWRPDHDTLLSLVRAHVLTSASLTELSFERQEGENDDDLIELALDVAAICTFAAGSSVGVAMLEMLGDDDAVIRRIVTHPVRSYDRPHEIVSDVHLPRLFRETFGSYVTMRQSHPAWRKLQSYCGSIEDCPYLEQKFASLVMALEFFMRNSLIEGSRAEKDVSGLSFPDLIGATKKHLNWHIPKHYTAGEVSRLLRNAVMHGGELPTKDNAEFRLQFDKWRLFLFRRVLIRLGYSGEVVSPYQGVQSSSAVNDFSVEHNSFEPDGAAANAVTRFVKELGVKASAANHQGDA